MCVGAHPWMWKPVLAVKCLPQLLSTPAPTETRSLTEQDLTVMRLAGQQAVGAPCLHRATGACQQTWLFNSIFFTWVFAGDQNSGLIPAQRALYSPAVFPSVSSLTSDFSPALSSRQPSSLVLAIVGCSRLCQIGLYHHPLREWSLSVATVKCKALEFKAWLCHLLAI